MIERNKMSKEMEEKILKFYSNHSKSDTCKEFNIGYRKLTNILNKYNACRKPAEKGKFISEKISRKISPEEEASIIDYYKTHSIPETSSYFNIPTDWISLFLRERGLTRQGEEKHSFIAEKRKTNSKKAINTIKGKEIAEYYLTHSSKETCNHFNIGTSRLYDICKEQGVKTRDLETSNQMRAQTCLENFGTPSPIENPEIWRKKEQTSLERYGVPNIAISPEAIKKRKQTNLKRYGAEFPSSIEEIKEKTTKTNIEKFGAKSIFCLKSTQEKRKKKAIQLYGHESPFADPTIFNKAKATMKERYGVENALQSPKLRAKQAKNAHHSNLEKRIEEFLINSKFKYTPQLTLKKDNLTHSFDFAIYKNNKIEMLIDCDGLFYHGYLTDTDGKKVNNYSDDYRSQLVPETTKFLIVLEGQEEEAYKEIMRIYDISYEEYVQDIFNWCREIEFPYPKYNIKTLNYSYKNLLKASPSQFNMRARYGGKIINHFHPSIFRATVGNHPSMFDAWQDDKLLTKCIKNRIIYKGHDLDRSKVLAGLNVTKIAPKISIFNPYLAKYLINKYLNSYQTIFDPFSGYSGRMLGACALGKMYIGQDLNPVTVEESNNMIKFFNLDAQVSQKDMLQDSGNYECLLTCPPYELKENWGQEIENKKCDEWIEECLKRYNCKRYIFVVDSTEKYKENIIEELVNKSHFGENKEYVLLFDKH